jgi:LacI family transcriptional regulator
MVDVARCAGVSLKTVSRVVNGEPGVREETTAAVQAAIDALAFRRNEAASNLRRGYSTSSLGLVLMDVANPFFSNLARAVEEVAFQHQFLVLSGSSDQDDERERKLALSLCSRRVDGLVIAPSGPDQSYLQPEIEAGTPVVFVDRPGSGVEADAVLVDNARATQEAVAHLAAHGHRRIAFLGDHPALYTTAERRRGYSEGLRALGLPQDPTLVAMGTQNMESILAVLEKLRTAHPPATALISGNNRVSLLVLRALAGKPWKPALVGFDDLELADLLQPALTVIEQDSAALGRQAAELLFSRLDGDDGPPRRIVLPTRLIPRGSGERSP